MKPSSIVGATRDGVAILAALAILALGSPVHAQETVAHDGLSSDAPTALTCGFCAGERFGVIFRELPAPERGVEPRDFPITLESVQVAVAAATVIEGPTCAPSETGATVTARVELYAGDEPPEGSIVSLAAEGPWSSTEALVWSTDAALVLSTAEPGGTGRYGIHFNELAVRDEAGLPVVIESGAYLRAVVSIPEASTMTSVTCAADVSPAFFPVRDADGPIADERAFIYASGLGWLWNEDTRVQAEGDWGIRLALFRTPSEEPDAGAPDPDAGASDPDARRDAGAPPEGDAGTPLDAEVRADAGLRPAGGGCSCRAIPSRAQGSASSAALLLALALLRRRTR